MIISDIDKIKQLLFILLFNAVKYTNRGKINVRVKLIGAMNEENIRIKVIDSGIGMCEE